MRSCGSCVGGRGCGGRVGGPKGCCLNRIANGGRVCRNQDDTGCMVEYKKKKPKEKRKKKFLNSIRSVQELDLLCPKVVML